MGAAGPEICWLIVFPLRAYRRLAEDPQPLALGSWSIPSVAITSPTASRAALDNVRAHRFYYRQGLLARALRFSRPVEPA